MLTGKSRLPTKLSKLAHMRSSISCSYSSGPAGTRGNEISSWSPISKSGMSASSTSGECFDGGKHAVEVVAVEECFGCFRGQTYVRGCVQAAWLRASEGRRSAVGSRQSEASR